VPRGRGHDGLQHVGRRRVHDRIVHEDEVERAAKVERRHVALNMLALGVHGAAVGQHRLRSVRERELEMRLQVIGEAAAARPEFEERPWREQGRREHRRQKVRGLFDVVSWRRQERPPPRKVGVQAKLLGRGHGESAGQPTAGGSAMPPI
jgi:hypothetical protein